MFVAQFTMYVRVKAKQADLPGGMERILEVLETSIAVRYTAVPVTVPDSD